MYSDEDNFTTDLNDTMLRLDAHVKALQAENNELHGRLGEKVGRIAEQDRLIQSLEQEVRALNAALTNANRERVYAQDDLNLIPGFIQRFFGV